VPNSYVRGNLANKLSSRHTHQTDCSIWTTKVVGYHTPLRTPTSAKLKEIRAVEEITNLLTNDVLQLRPSVDSSLSASFFVVSGYRDFVFCIIEIRTLLTLLLGRIAVLHT